MVNIGKILPKSETEKGPTLDFITRQFQQYFESGYTKTTTLRALDEKLDKLKISANLEMGLRRFKRKKSKTNVNPASKVSESKEVDSTFEIGRRTLQNIPSTSASGIQIRDITSEPSDILSPDQQLDREDLDLEDRLRALLGETFSV